MTQHPQHTENSLLTRYLLPPSSLPTIIPHKDFLTFHKSSSDPATAHALKKLYQDLQFQRNIDIDTVRFNIDRECARGSTLKAKLRQKLRGELGEDGRGKKQKRGSEGGGAEGAYVSEPEDEVSGHDRTYDALNDPKEMAIDSKFFGPHGAVLPSTKRRYHTTASLLEAMQQSIDELDREISDLDGSSEDVLGNMQETVSALSDLRYGKFSRISGGGQGEEGAIEGGVVEALQELTNVASRKSNVRSKGRPGV